jgi:hypothetical protein
MQERLINKRNELKIIIIRTAKSDDVPQLVVLLKALLANRITGASYAGSVAKFN